MEDLAGGLLIGVSLFIVFILILRYREKRKIISVKEVLIWCAVILFTLIAIFGKESTELSYEAVDKNGKDLTTIELKNYASLHKGERVDWKGTVDDVVEDNGKYRMTVNMDGGIFDVILNCGYPVPRLKRGELCRFSGTISSITAPLGLTFVELNNVKFE